MKTGASLKNRQGGAVAVVVGISIVLLVGFLAMVIDLGHLYVAKTGLQNAADAAALSGVKQLDGSADGICCGDGKNGTKLSAVYMAIDTAGRNTFFGNNADDVVNIGSVNSSNPNIRFSRSQDGPENEDEKWGVSITTAMASPGDKYFIKVDTASGNLKTWFSPVWEIFGPGQGIMNTSTFGMAVSGPLLKNVTPMGVCAIDVIVNPGTPQNPPYDNRICGGPGNECGFLRGVAYNIIDINPMMASSYPIWINPVDVPPGNCDPNHAAASYMRPFVCEGKAAVGEIPGPVYANAGVSSTLDSALNSRFDDFSGGSKCDPTTAPPDTNVKQYMWNPGPLPGGGCPPGSNNANCGHPRDWMEPTNNTTPTQQGITIASNHLPSNYPVPPETVGYSARPPSPGTFSDWGALWTYSRERHWSPTGTGSDYGLCDWGDNTTVPVGDPCYGVSGANLYGGQADQTGDGYPQVGGTSVPPYPHVGGTPVPPYWATSGKYFEPPNPSRPGKQDRRVLNVLIIDCQAPGFPVPGPGAACAQLYAIAIGKFFMPVQANLSSYVYGEFAGLLPQGLLKPQYVLFK